MLSITKPKTQPSQDFEFNLLCQHRDHLPLKPVDLWIEQFTKQLKESESADLNKEDDFAKYLVFINNFTLICSLFGLDSLVDSIYERQIKESIELFVKTKNNRWLDGAFQPKINQCRMYRQRLNFLNHKKAFRNISLLQNDFLLFENTKISHESLSQMQLNLLRHATIEEFVKTALLLQDYDTIVESAKKLLRLNRHDMVYEGLFLALQGLGRPQEAVQVIQNAVFSHATTERQRWVYGLRYAEALLAAGSSDGIEILQMLAMTIIEADKLTTDDIILACRISQLLKADRPTAEAVFAKVLNSAQVDNNEMLFIRSAQALMKMGLTLTTEQEEQYETIMRKTGYPSVNNNQRFKPELIKIGAQLVQSFMIQ